MTCGQDRLSPVFVLAGSVCQAFKPIGQFVLIQLAAFGLKQVSNVRRQIAAELVNIRHQEHNLSFTLKRPLPPRFFDDAVASEIVQHRVAKISRYSASAGFFANLKRLKLAYDTISLLCLIIWKLIFAEFLRRGARILLRRCWHANERITDHEQKRFHRKSSLIATCFAWRKPALEAVMPKRDAFRRPLQGVQA